MQIAPPTSFQEINSAELNDFLRLAIARLEQVEQDIKTKDAEFDASPMLDDFRYLLAQSQGVSTRTEEKEIPLTEKERAFWRDRGPLILDIFVKIAVEIGFVILRG